eukprot:2378038-Lingulodinium_polyedra.AAC.1
MERRNVHVCSRPVEHRLPVLLAPSAAGKHVHELRGRAPALTVHHAYFSPSCAPLHHVGAERLLWTVPAGRRLRAARGMIETPLPLQCVRGHHGQVKPLDRFACL